MSMHYVKLWSNLVKSSILEEDLPVRWLWIVLLLESDQLGNVYGTPEALARIANLDLDCVKEGLAILMAPDPNSTTGDEEGRRILNPGPNLWYIVNFQKYRGIKDIGEERKKVAERVRKHREKKRDVTDVTPDVTPGNPIVLCSKQRHKAEEEKTETLPCPPAVDDQGFKQFWDAYPKKKKKQDALRAWKATKKIRPPLEILLESVRRHAKTFDWEKEGGQYIPGPGPYLRGGCWDDDLAVFTGRLNDPVCPKCLVHPPSVDPPSQFCPGCLEGILADADREGVRVE